MPKITHAEKKKKTMGNILKRMCPFCRSRTVFSSFQVLRIHINKCARMLIEARKKADKKMPQDEYYDPAIDVEDKTLIRYPCPSCTELFTAKPLLKTHILNTHVILSKNDELSDEEWSVNGVDIKKRFESFRQDSLSIGSDKYNLNQDLHSILSLSSIMVLQKRYKYTDLANVFLKENDYKYLYGALYGELNPNEQISTDTLTSIYNNLKNFKNGESNDIETRIKMLELAKDSTSIEQNIILAVESLLPTLKDLNTKKITESELAASFIHPVIQALFAVTSSDTIARCFNNTPIEDDEHKKRPDYTVDIYHSYEYAFTSVYGEIKIEGTNEVDSTRDFYRLCMFSKQSIQQNNLNYGLFFQAIGPTITFYLMKCIDKVTICIELDTLVIPLTRRKTLDWIGYLDVMLNVATLHVNMEMNTNNQKTKNMPDEDIQMYVKSKEKKGRVALGPLALL